MKDVYEVVSWSGETVESGFKSRKEAKEWINKYGKLSILKKTI